MRDHSNPPVADRTAAESPATAPRPLGWGAGLAVAGMALFAVGLLFIGMAFDSMTVDQPGQWMPIYIALGVMALLVMGLARRSRIAFAATIALAGYQLLTSVLAIARTGLVGAWQFGLISVVPALLVLIGLAASWRAYWRPNS